MAVTPIDQPYDIDAEMATLGAILLNRDALITIAPVLYADDFYVASHQHIYAAMLALYQQRQPPDVRTVGALLKQRQQLEQIGGTSYLLSLMDAPVTSHHAPTYARIVADLALRRRVIATGGRIAAIGYEQTNATEAYALASAALTAAGQTRRGGEWTHISDVLDTLIDRMARGETRGVCTGLHDLDALTGGLYPGDLTILAGRPGHGKTSAAMTIADYVARQGMPVLFVSLEMAREELVQRLLAMYTNVPANAQRRQALTPAQIESLTRGMSKISELPLHIDDQRGMTIADLRARCLAAAHAMRGVGLMVLDYVGLMTTTIRNGMNQAQAIGEISRGLKILARELDAPILALAQLNRELDARAGHVPELSDLRDSGSLEQDADQVVFIVRHELYEPESAEYRGKARLYLRKNRHDRTGVVDVAFDGETTMIRNLAAYRCLAGCQIPTAKAGGLVLAPPTGVGTAQEAV